MKKLKKHANLEKPKIGKFARNEWAIIGAPCGEIKSLVERLAKLSTSSIIYIDESHDKQARTADLAVATKKGEAFDFASPHEWNENTNTHLFNPFHIALVNGNHFKAAKQILILDERKKESLGRKLDRLTDVRLIIRTSEGQELYDFLNDETTAGVPILDIKDTDGILEFIVNDSQVPQLRGLVLAGGRSVRMGEDKAGISYHGVSQAEYMCGMLESIGIKPYISCRTEQTEKHRNHPVVEDKFLGLGPFGAIASAFMTDPNCAWLVVPCDLPLLNVEHLKTLTSSRNPGKYGTAFLNNETNFPEPLISIWEPRMYQRMLSFLAYGYSCPRKVLINSNVELIHVDDQQFMMNANTPEERRRAEIILEEGQA